ncbi:MAG: hypothetical protein QG582_878, partial [Candidatus Thermoplasmatota archaeon]|nr:hypothetical protein [Candidatus Thermoplasmatota archaeon]
NGILLLARIRARMVNRSECAGCGEKLRIKKRFLDSAETITA